MIIHFIAINAGFFDYGIMCENEIIPVSNQATELPNLIHVFSCSTLGQTKSIAFAKDFLPEKTCKLLRRLLYRNGFVLCSVLASPIFVWRNGTWKRRKLLRKRHMRNVRTTCWLDSITRTASGIEDDCFP